MKPLEPLLPGEMRSEYLRRVDSPMGRARALVEAHIADYGMVPHPDKIKEAIAAELGSISADRARAILIEAQATVASIRTRVGQIHKARQNLNANSLFQIWQAADQLLDTARALQMTIDRDSPSDGEAGMAWWNGLSDDERKQWAIRAGNTGRASDAWEAYKRQKAGG